MHGRQLAGGRRIYKEIEGLRLADICAAVGCHIDDITLFDLPDGLVDLLDVLRDLIDVLDRAIVEDDLVLHVIVPEIEIDQVFQQMFVHYHEFTAEYPADIDVRCIWFEALVVAQDL